MTLPIPNSSSRIPISSPVLPKFCYTTPMYWLSLLFIVQVFAFVMAVPTPRYSFSRPSTFSVYSSVRHLRASVDEQPLRHSFSVSSLNSYFKSYVPPSFTCLKRWIEFWCPPSVLSRFQADQHRDFLPLRRAAVMRLADTTINVQNVTQHSDHQAPLISAPVPVPKKKSLMRDEISGNSRTSIDETIQDNSNKTIQKDLSTVDKQFSNSRILGLSDLADQASNGENKSTLHEVGTNSSISSSFTNTPTVEFTNATSSHKNDARNENKVDLDEDDDLHSGSISNFLAEARAQRERIMSGGFIELIEWLFVFILVAPGTFPAIGCILYTCTNFVQRRIDSNIEYSSSTAALRHQRNTFVMRQRHSLLDDSPFLFARSRYKPPTIEHEDP